MGSVGNVGSAGYTLEKVRRKRWVMQGFCEEIGKKVRNDFGTHP